MDKKFLIKLAIRNLLSHRMRTILTLVGIIIGISAVVFLISFGSGIQKLVTEQITGGDAFQLIDIGTGNSQVVKMNTEMVSKLTKINGISSVETITNLAGKAKKDANEMDVAFFGTSAAYLDWSGKKIRYGNNLSKTEPDSSKKTVVVNTSYLNFLGKDRPEDQIGKTVKFNIIVPKEISSDSEAKTYLDQEFVITGVIKDESSPSIYTLGSNFDAYKINSYSQAKVRIAERNNVSTIRKHIESLGLKTQYVGDTVSQVEQVFGVFKIILGGFGIIALLVALLGMFNTLTISLLERIKEVALMKILGMNKKDIRSLFLIEALALGISGSFVGIIWGILMGKIANYILVYFAVRAGGDPVSVFYYPFSLFAGIIAISVAFGFVTGIYPAKRASQVNALDVLRYE